MNEQERKICARVKLLRERVLWPQPAFAAEIGITINRLASLEYGRTPLRYGLAKAICKRCGVSLLWLASGTPPERPYREVPALIDGQIDPETLLSQACREVRFPMLVETALSGSDIEVTFMKSSTPTEMCEDVVRSFMAEMPEHLQKEFQDQLSLFAANFRKEHLHDIKRRTVKKTRGKQ